MEIGKHPPMPRLAIRVGVSGHRYIDEANVGRIEAEVASTFAILDRTVAELALSYAAYFDPRPPLKRLISSLAEGADTLVADIAETHGYAIQAPLPFPIAEYRRDFDETKSRAFEHRLEFTDSVFELDGRRDGERVEESAYLAAGYLTLRQCDILMAVWDGKAARGVGGTAMIVEAAVQRGVPVIWIHSQEAATPCLLRADLLPGPTVEEVRGILWQALAPPFVPGAVKKDGFSASSKRGADEFFREIERRLNMEIPFRLFQSLITFKKPLAMRLRHKEFVRATEEDWGGFAKLVRGQRKEIWQRIEKTLAPRFSWADGLAKYYAAIYRSSYVVNYMLGAAAVLLALVGLVLPVSKEILIAIEIAAILAVLGVTTMGHRRSWHERWIDYRQLAEQLRHLRFLYLTGAASSNTSGRHQYDRGGSEGGWAQWYHQATVRELGLAPASATPAYIAAVRDLFLEEEISNQIEYHHGNARRMHTLEHALHKLGDLLFAAALVVCAIYLGYSFLSRLEAFEHLRAFKEDVVYWVIFLTAFLPALGAAMSGIRVQGEFGSSAERSEAMAARLSQLRDDLLTDDKAKGANLSRLRSFIETASETMMVENIDWRFVFRGKPLSLPA